MKLFIQEETLNEIGNAIREKTETGDLIAPGDMPGMIRSIETGGGESPIPEEALHLTGNCSHKFANDAWTWFLDAYGNQMTTQNITSATSMFEGSYRLTNIPFALNFCDPLYGAGVSMQNIFNNDSNISEVTINITGAPPTIGWRGAFNYCMALRRINLTCDRSIYQGDGIYGTYSTFADCYCLDELIEIPFVYSTYNTNYCFYGAFNRCHRLQNLTFKSTEVLTATNYKGAVIDLTEGVGWSTYNASSIKSILPGKEVTDEASYEALRYDPDWWTQNVAYSRYNHDSAVRTINSLPDVTQTGQTSTIKFKGEAGSATAQGAINTLTDAEIAVATAKGWTVSLV